MILYVALGGAVGSVARYLLTRAIITSASPHSPLGTFAVNMIGCFVFGLVAAAAERQFPLTPNARAFLVVGLLGGFTTFSSYVYETFLLAGHGQLLYAAANAAGQVFLGLLVLWAGYALLR